MKVLFFVAASIALIALPINSRSQTKEQIQEWCDGFYSMKLQGVNTNAIYRHAMITGTEKARKEYAAMVRHCPDALK
jgi:malonyl CoA-acyl carrier protein transacylase